MTGPLHIDYRLRAAGWKHCEVCYLPMPGSLIEAHQKEMHAGPIKNAYDRFADRAREKEQRDRSRNSYRSNFSRRW